LCGAEYRRLQKRLGNTAESLRCDFIGAAMHRRSRRECRKLSRFFRRNVHAWNKKHFNLPTDMWQHGAFTKR
jgi:hypothetical protein